MLVAIDFLPTQCETELFWLIALRIGEKCGLATLVFEVLPRLTEFMD